MLSKILLLISILLINASLTAAQGRVDFHRDLSESLAGMFQFVDRIVRPCTSGAVSQASVIVNPNNSTNVAVTTCTGGAFTVNGVPIAPGAGLPDPGSNGYVVRTALNTDVARTFTVTAPVTVTNANGVAGGTNFACPACVTSAAALTNTAIMTGAGGQASQTPAATATLSAAGNISTPGNLTTGSAGGVTGSISLSGATSGTVGITVAAIAGTWTLTLPTDDGTPGQVLSTDGAGVTSWVTPSSGPTINATNNVLPKRLSATAFTNSRITDTGTNITINSQSGNLSAGDTSAVGNGTQIVITDISSIISLTATKVSANTIEVSPSADNNTDLGNTLTSYRQLFISATITAAGTTGDQTINKSAGSVNFAALATSLVVTSNKVTANSIVMCTVATNDTTLKSVQCVPTAGSFTMFANAAATAETRVNFWILNQ